MVAVPACLPVIIPAALIVATLVLLLLQIPPVVALANWVVAAKQTCCVPVIAATVGKGLIVPLTAIFWLVAPVELNIILPDGVPTVEVINLTNTVVLESAPLIGENSILLLNIPFSVVDS